MGMNAVRYVRVPNRVSVERLEQAWDWRTSDGEPMHAVPGDYHVTDLSSGRQWSVAAAAMRSGYKDLGDGQFESRGEVTATQVGVNSAPVDVASLEGPEVAGPSDWIVADLHGRVWVVDDVWFRDHYVEVHDQEYGGVHA